MKRNSTAALICRTALFTALVCVATVLIRIPSPLGGYINFGDCFLFMGAWLLPPLCGAAAGALGSAVADLLSGWAIYAPATLIIKSVMSLTAYALYKKAPKACSKPFGAVSAEIIMVAGYYIFEAIFVYGAEASLANVPYNAIQGVLGIIGGIIISVAAEKALSKIDRS